MRAETPVGKVAAGGPPGTRFHSIAPLRFFFPQPPQATNLLAPKTAKIEPPVPVQPLRPNLPFRHLAHKRTFLQNVVVSRASSCQFH